jgi:hypothetical protein
LLSNPRVVLITELLRIRHALGWPLWSTSNIHGLVPLSENFCLSRPRHSRRGPRAVRAEGWPYGKLEPAVRRRGTGVRASAVRRIASRALGSICGPVWWAGGWRPLESGMPRVTASDETRCSWFVYSIALSFAMAGMVRSSRSHHQAREMTTHVDGRERVRPWRVNMGRRAVPGLVATRGRRVLTDVDGGTRLSSQASESALAVPGRSVRGRSGPWVPVAAWAVGPRWRLLADVGRCRRAVDQHRTNIAPCRALWSGAGRAGRGAGCWPLLANVGGCRSVSAHSGPTSRPAGRLSRSPHARRAPLTPRSRPRRTPRGRTRPRRGPRRA